MNEKNTENKVREEKAEKKIEGTGREERPGLLLFLLHLSLVYCFLCSSGLYSPQRKKNE